MTRVTISTILDAGPSPQFFEDFKRSYDADDYIAMWREIAASAGVIIRVDRSDTSDYKQPINNGDTNV